MFLNFIYFVDPSLKIIAALPNKKFLNYLVYSFIFQTGLMIYGRPEFYFLLPPSVFKVKDVHAYYLLNFGFFFFYELPFNI